MYAQAQSYSMATLPPELRALPYVDAAASAALDAMCKEDLDNLKDDERAVREFGSITGQLQPAEKMAQAEREMVQAERKRADDAEAELRHLKELTAEQGAD